MIRVTKKSLIRKQLTAHYFRNLAAQNQLENPPPLLQEHCCRKFFRSFLVKLWKKHLHQPGVQGSQSRKPYSSPLADNAGGDS